MDCEPLNTGVLLIDSDLQQIEKINSSAEKILGWDITTLNQNLSDLRVLSQGLAAFAKLIASMRSAEQELEICKRIEIKINSQYYNLYLQQLEQGYLIELSQIIYQDMKQSTHELKRPIQNIKTLVETLLMGAKDDPSRCDDYLTKLNHEADRLGTMVQDMLSLSHVLNGSVEMNKIELNLVTEVAKLIALAEGRAAKKNISLSFDIDDSVVINADKKFFEHLLANLIDNAIKYNKDSGSVELKYEDGVLSVRDTGRGIPQEDLAKVFDQFYRVQESAEIQGTGLGLAIVKAIVDLHGWQIDIESQIDQGSCFKIIV